MATTSKQSLKLRFTIYGQVVITITLLSVFFFIAFGIIFRRVSQGHLNEISQTNGSNISSIVEGALYHSMLTNDRSGLENTLDVINDLPGIEDVNMYDSLDNVVYSAFRDRSEDQPDPDCKGCHTDLNSMFSRTEKTFKIINLDSNCEMSMTDHSYRLLMIKSPIMNELSCYTAACHAHKESDQVLGSIIVRIPLEDLDHAIKLSSKDFFILAAVATVLLAAFLMFFTRRNINAPLNEIIRASTAVSKGDRTTRLHLENSRLDDIKLVSSTFNNMLDNLHAANEELQNWSSQLEEKVRQKSEELSEMQNELIHVERIASLGKLSSSVAHEINNPLSGVLTFTKLVQKQLGKLDLDKDEKGPMMNYLQVIEEETKRCGDIVKGLLDFSSKSQIEFKPEHLNRVLEEVYTLMEHQMEMSEIKFRVELKAGHDLISCSPNQLKQAFIAVILNAYEAVETEGEILIATSNPEKNKVRIDVKDNGVGISAEDLPNVFEPFFSAKEKVSGIGLGLAIVHGIIESHNGIVGIESEQGRGTTVHFILPVIRDRHDPDKVIDTLM